ncbi:MAG: SDR family oxidoreductase [Candidatus Thermoplasmatota archaeon]|nr:SDR family oxidoreductase [Candidatus Thermoplasmatota archaeon]
MADNGERSVVLITGGYRNLGFWISRELKKAGYYVVATYRTDRERAEATAIDLHIPIYKADVTIREDVLSLFERIEANDSIVGAVVNNASTFPTGPLQTLSLDDFEDTFRTSVFASNMIINRALPGMNELGGGKIINIGMAGLTEGRAYTRVAAHAAAKTALMVLTRSWAKELRNENIMVNMVSPGMIDYGREDEEWRARMRRAAPSGKLTSPLEVASAVRYLLETGDVSGKVIEVDPTFNISSL